MTEGGLQHGATDPQKPVGDPAAIKSVTRTEALKSLTLYASEDSDMEITVLSKPSDGSKSYGDDSEVASAEKVTKPKLDDSSKPSNRHKEEQHSDVCDTELRSSHRDRGDSERKRPSSVKERHSSKERETSRYKDTLPDRKSCERAKSGDSRGSNKKSHNDEKAGSDRASRHPDPDTKKSRDGTSQSSEKKRQDDEKGRAGRCHKHSDPDAKKSPESTSRSSEEVTHNTLSSQHSSHDRHRESSRSLKEHRKAESYSSSAEKNYKVPSTKGRMSPSRPDSGSFYKKSTDNKSRSSEKINVHMEDSTVKPKAKEAEPCNKIDADRKPVKSDHSHDDRKPDAEKMVEKHSPVDHQKEKPHDVKTEKKKDDDYDGERRRKEDRLKLDTGQQERSSRSQHSRSRSRSRERKRPTAKDSSHSQKHKVDTSSDGKASFSAAPLSDTKSAVSRKHHRVSTSSSSSSSVSGSSSSDSESHSSSSSSSSSDSSDDEDTAAAKEKSSHLKTKLHENCSKPSVHSAPEKATVRDTFDDVRKLHNNKKAGEFSNDNVSLNTAHAHEKTVSVKEDADVSCKSTDSGNGRIAHSKLKPTVECPKASDVKISVPAVATDKDRSTHSELEPVTTHPKMSDVKILVSEEPALNSSADLYSPSFPTDVDIGWEDDVGGNASRWSSSSESDVDDVPPPPPPRSALSHPPSTTLQSTTSAGTDSDEKMQSAAVPGSATAADCAVMSGTGCVQSATFDISKLTGGGLKQKIVTERSIPEPGDGHTQSSSYSRSEKKSVSGGADRPKLDSEHRDRSGSNCSSSSSRSRSRSRERRYNAKDSRHSQDTVNRQHSIVVDKTASRLHDIQHSPSPPVLIDSPKNFPVRSSLPHYGITRRYSDVQSQSSSYSSNRSTAVRQVTGSRNVGNSDEPVVVIDSDDDDDEEDVEDPESLERIPLPADVLHTVLDDIPLPPVAASESSDANTEDNTSKIDSVETANATGGNAPDIHPVDKKKSDSTPPVMQIKESVCEMQKSPEKVVSMDAENVIIDMDLDDPNSDSSQNVDTDTPTVSMESGKGPVFSTGKIVLSLGGGRTQPGHDRSTSSMTAFDVSNTWKRKLAGGLLKAPKLAHSKTESAAEVKQSTKQSDSENLESATSTMVQVRKESEPLAEVKSAAVSEKPSSWVDKSSKFHVTDSHNPPVVGKSQTVVSNSSNSAPMPQKPRRRFTDAPSEKSAGLSFDPTSKPHATNVVQGVKVERAYHVLQKQQHGEETKNVVSEENKPGDSVLLHTESKHSATDKSCKSANQDSHSVNADAVSESVWSVAANECINSEAARSKSPTNANKNKDQHKSSTSHTEKSSRSSRKDEVDDNGGHGSRDRRNSEDDRRKHSSSNRRKSRSPDCSTSSKQKGNLSCERESHRFRERAAKEESRHLSPETRLHTSKERDAKNCDRSVRRKSPGDWTAEKQSHEKYREHHPSGRHSDRVAKDLPSSSASRRSPRRRSPSGRRDKQDRNIEVKKSPPHLCQTTSREKLVAVRRDQNESKSHPDLKIDSPYHSFSRRDDTVSEHSCAYQENRSYSDRDPAGRYDDPNSRRSCDRVSKPHSDDRRDGSQNRHIEDRSELFDRSRVAVATNQSPLYDDDVVILHEADRSRDQHRSVSKDRCSLSQARDYFRPNVRDYSPESLSVDGRNLKTESIDRYDRSRSRRSSSPGSREYSRQETRDYSGERLLIREDNREHISRRRESPHDSYRPSSPSNWQKMPSHTQHSPLLYGRPARSSVSRNRSLSCERSPECRQRRKSPLDRNERGPSLREAESRSRRIEKRSYDRDERSSSRSRRDVSYCRSPPRRQRSLTPDREAPTSPIGRKSFARNRRSTSRDRRFVEHRESNVAYRRSQSPFQRAKDSKRVSPRRSRVSLLEEPERSLRRRDRIALTERRSRSADRKRRRRSSERRSRSRDRRPQSDCRDLSPSLHSDRHRCSRVVSRDVSPRRDSRSPLSPTPREGRHSNRDIVQFLMDTGIIASSKSDSSRRDAGHAVDVVVSSVVSMAVSATAQSSYPIVPTPTLMQGTVVPPVPYVDNASVPYIATPYPPTAYLPASFPAPPSRAPNPWYQPPGVQPLLPFPNQPAPVPYPGMQPVPPAVAGLGPGRPPVPGLMQQCVVPGVPSAPARDWRGSFSQTVPGTVNRPNFIPRETRLPQPLFGTTALGQNALKEKPKKQDLDFQQLHQSAKSDLIKAIADSAVWIPSVDSSTPKPTPESQSSDLSEHTAAGNKASWESTVPDSADVMEPEDKTSSVFEETSPLQDIVDQSSTVPSPPAGCLWECIPVTVVDATSLAAMEAEDLTSASDGKGNKRKRGQPASEGRETRRRSSRLKKLEEEKKLDDTSDDKASDSVSKSTTDMEQSKPLVKNLKARILQDYESEAGNLNLPGSSDATDGSMSNNAAYKVPAEAYSPMVAKPEKVKSRWRRWSELESDGEQSRQPPPPASLSPSSTTPVTSAADDQHIVEEDKPPYFEPLLDNLFLSVRSVFLYSPVSI